MHLSHYGGREQIQRVCVLAPSAVVAESSQPFILFVQVDRRSPLQRRRALHMTSAHLVVLSDDGEKKKTRRPTRPTAPSPEFWPDSNVPVRPPRLSQDVWSLAHGAFACISSLGLNTSRPATNRVSSHDK